MPNNFIGRHERIPGKMESLMREWYFSTASLFIFEKRDRKRKNLNVHKLILLTV